MMQQVLLERLRDADMVYLSEASKLGAAGFPESYRVACAAWYEAWDALREYDCSGSYEEVLEARC